MTDSITPQQFLDADGTADWRVLGDGACAFFRTGSFADSARLVEAIGGLSQARDHPPDVDVRAGGVTVRLVTATDESFGMTVRDADLARRISGIAADLGMPADPSAVQSTLTVIGAVVSAAVMPFWRAVFGYVPRPDSPDEDLVDPAGRWPGFWFETMDEPRPPSGRIHLAVWVPPELAEGRVAAALAAGGRIVSDAYAPSWWTLADPEGNEADVSTILGRD